MVMRQCVHLFLLVSRTLSVIKQASKFARGLSLGDLFCSIGLIVCLYADTTLSNHYSFLINLDTW